MMWILPLLAFFLWGAVLWFLPKVWRRFILTALAAMALSLVVLSVLGPLLGYWRFVNTLVIGGVPVFLPLVYGALAVFLAQFLPGRSGERALYVLSFGGGEVILHWVLLRAGLLTYTGWNMLFTFFLGVVFYSFVLYFRLVLSPGVTVTAGGERAGGWPEGALALNRVRAGKVWSPKGDRKNREPGAGLPRGDDRA